MKVEEILVPESVKRKCKRVYKVWPYARVRIRARKRGSDETCSDKYCKWF
jgi:hypothetical protein